MTNDTSTVNEAWEDYVGTHPNSLKYPKRLIEVDLPIARISAHARREKSIRRGHISTLHIWWARRPLAACRAVICASLWPDPADPLCPIAFREASVKQIKEFAARAASSSLPAGLRPKLNEEQAVLERGLSKESRARWEAISSGSLTLDAREPVDMGILRLCLLDFIADFANWDNGNLPAYLETSRSLTSAAHEALGGTPGSRPLVVDPFAGGGSIPLEAVRVGADAFASDVNPIAVLLNKIAVESVPRFGEELASEIRKWGNWVGERAKIKLDEFYPVEKPGDEEPLAYLWARTIECGGPGCGAEIPLIRSMVLAKTNRRGIALRLVVDGNRINFELMRNPSSKDVPEGTVKRGSVNCPCCGYTTPLSEVKEQLKLRNGGAKSARMFCVITRPAGSNEQTYRLPTDCDLSGIEKANTRLRELEKMTVSGISLVPHESTTHYHSFVNRGPIYGMTDWSMYFTPRQLVAHCTFVELIREAAEHIEKNKSTELSTAVSTCLAMAFGKCLDYMNSVCSWMPRGTVGHLFARQAIPMTWDFPEANPVSNFHCAWQNAFEWSAAFCESEGKAIVHTGQAERASASSHVLPDDFANAFITDPPYYYSVQYADLSDFFYIWLRRILKEKYPALFVDSLTAKEEEIIVQSPGHEFAETGKNNAFFERRMTLAMSEGRRILAPNGIGIVVFAHTSTAGWEAQLQAMLDAGWIVTGSWPIDTERSARTLAIGRSVLASSVHLVCRPRENTSGQVTDSIGDWRDVLAELPKRIHQWMPRLTAEGVVGADAIFACLGPALEIFSKYSRVEKSNGDAATLREYLEFVWAAVSTEALALIFRDADTSGLEPDARLTAMWLWTLGGGKDEGKVSKSNEEIEDVDEDDSTRPKVAGGYTLEFDAARKIAQGLGVHLEQCTSLVEIKGDQAQLLPVGARTRYLFGTDATRSAGRGTGKLKQKTLFDELDEAEAAEAGWTDLKGPPPGSTTLDRVHQAMILFAANRGELLKRFLVDDGVGKESRFWKLADNLNKLYPTGSEERRWVEGVLARKRGLGL